MRACSIAYSVVAPIFAAASSSVSRRSIALPSSGIRPMVLAASHRIYAELLRRGGWLATVVPLDVLVLAKWLQCLNCRL